MHHNYCYCRDVERSDEGQYMCQINTARAKTRLGNLHVVGETVIIFVIFSNQVLTHNFVDNSTLGRN